jgi:LysM repeat protein
MMRLRFLLPMVFGALCLTMVPAQAQDKATLATLSRKIDDQNIKIDALSQQILKLQEEVALLHSGSAAPVAKSVDETSTPSSLATPESGPTHVVTRGETLTSIARQHKVSVADLQKLNHIQNDRTLQIGQTLVIPGASTASPSPTATPNE